MKNFVRKWSVANPKGKDTYRGILDREDFLKIFHYFTIPFADADRVVDVSKLRIEIAGYCYDHENREFANGMKTSLVRCIRRTAMFAGEKTEPVYAIHTNTGSTYYVIWGERSQWQWDSLMNILHGRLSEFTPPTGYVAVDRPEDVPRIPDDTTATCKFDVPKEADEANEA